jgi:hypothetical protein
LAGGRDPDLGRGGVRFFFEAMCAEGSARFTYHQRHAERW